MIKAILTTLLVTAMLTCIAQPQMEPAEQLDEAIVYNEPSTTMQAALYKMLSDIMQVTGSKTPFELKEAEVLNLEAKLSKKKRWILYNPAFMSWINSATHDKWGTMALLAHEIGHHLNGHTKHRTGSKPALELEADEFAGSVLAKLGASLEEAQEVMFYVAKTDTSSTHPARAERLAAIRKGWEKPLSKNRL